MQIEQKIAGRKFQIRVQERRFVSAEILYKGQQVVGGMAICNPVDGFNLEFGQDLAIERAIKQLINPAAPKGFAGAVVRMVKEKVREKQQATIDPQWLTEQRRIQGRLLNPTSSSELHHFHPPARSFWSRLKEELFSQ